MAWSPNGNKLASVGAGVDHQVYIWADGNCIYTMPGHTAEVRGIAWSPDGRLLASGSDDMTVRLWDANTYELRHVIDGRTKIHGLDWSLDSTILAIAGHTQGVHRLDIQDNGQPLSQLRGMGQFEPAYCVKWSPDGRLLAAGGGRIRSSVLVWNTIDGLTKDLTIKTDMILSIAWSPNSALLVAGLSDGSIPVWNTSNWNELKILRGHTDIITSVHFSWQGDFLASKSADGLVCLWSCENWEKVAQMPDPGTGGFLFAPLAFHPKDMKLATLGRSGHAIRTWAISPLEMNPLKPITIIPPPPLHIPRALAEAVFRDQCVLFAGAGFSKNSIDISGNSLKDVIGEAIKEDCREYEYSSRSFEDVADDYVVLNDLQSLLDKLASYIPQNTPTSNAHIAAIEMFPHIITTNWDILFEAAYRNKSQNRQILIDETDANNFHAVNKSLIKMHGTVERPNTLVATSTQFDVYSRQHIKLIEIIESLLLQNTVLFVGYNLRELHIRHLLSLIHYNRGAFARRAYAVGFFDKIDIQRLRKQEIEVINYDAERFILELANKIKFPM